jgi:hypothetical protein
MMRRRPVSAIIAVLCLFGLVVLEPKSPLAVGRLPKQLSDRAFWQMVVDFSEPGGIFRSDNFVSNEKTYQEIIPELKKRSSPDGAYLGVGPDQNFTYIAAVRPRIAFIIDIRRQNLIHHLLYKALIEMSDDRAEFVSRLFSRPRAPGLEKSATPAALFRSFETAEPSETAFQTNLQDVENRLIKRHGFVLTTEDRRTLEYVYRAFYSEGPGLRYSFPRQRSAPWFPSYAELMQATDLNGLNHSYLSNEENYRMLREFQRNNLLVPIVGDFAGDKAIRTVGRYLSDHGATANYFYTSNVEQYLFQGDAYEHYYSSVGALPLNEKSTFIRSYFNMGFRYPPGIVTPDLHSVQLLDPILGFLSAFRAGQIHTYSDVVERPK